MRLEKESFGPVLRAGRERRRVSLARICDETNVSPDIWIGLEENNFSRWPTRIYARNLIRQYAERVGLNPEELVNDFCRLFPCGDRRAESLIREHAALIGHRLEWREDPPSRYGPPRRRAGDGAAAETPSTCGFLRERAASIIADAVGILDALTVLVFSKTTS